MLYIRHQSMPNILHEYTKQWTGEKKGKLQY